MRSIPLNMCPVFSVHNKQKSIAFLSYFSVTGSTNVSMNDDDDDDGENDDDDDDDDDDDADDDDDDKAYLDASLSESEALTQLFPHERVRVVSLVEQSLQLGQLIHREVGSTASLFRLLLLVVAICRRHALPLLLLLLPRDFCPVHHILYPPVTKATSKTKMSTTVGMGHLSPAAQGPKFKIPLHKNFVPRPIKYTCQASSTSAQRSRSLRVLKMLTPHGRTDGRTDGHLTSVTRHLWRDD